MQEGTTLCNIIIHISKFVTLRLCLSEFIKIITVLRLMEMRNHSWELLWFNVFSKNWAKTNHFSQNTIALFMFSSFCFLQITKMTKNTICSKNFKLKKKKILFLRTIPLKLCQRGPKHFSHCQKTCFVNWISLSNQHLSHPSRGPRKR